MKKGCVSFRCENTAVKGNGMPVCPLSDDLPYSDFKGSKTPLKKKHVFNARQRLLSSRMPAQAVCPVCGKVSHDKICPKCHSRLPNDIGETENLLFAIIGAKEVGKSHYLAVLINIITDVLTSSFPFSISAANDETGRRYNLDFRKKLFEDKETITATKSGLTDRNVRSPLIYHLRFYKTLKNGKKIPSRTVTIAFFDTAGEDLNDEDTMSAVNKYIYNSSGIIFLLDPLQLDSVRSALPKGTPMPEKYEEIDSIITRTIRLIRKAKGISANHKIKIPLAAAFTKIDALKPILDRSSSLNYSSRHIEYGKFDIADAENVSSEIEALLTEWTGGNFVKQISINFENYSYFGLSALGCNPQYSRHVEKVDSRRVEDPFLWLLWKHRLISGQ